MHRETISKSLTGSPGTSRPLGAAPARPARSALGEAAGGTAAPSRPARRPIGSPFGDPVQVGDAAGPEVGVGLLPRGDLGQRGQPPPAEPPHLPFHPALLVGAFPGRGERGLEQGVRTDPCRLSGSDLSDRRHRGHQPARWPYAPLRPVRETPLHRSPSAGDASGEEVRDAFPGCGSCVTLSGALAQRPSPAGIGRPDEAGSHKKHVHAAYQDHLRPT